MLNVNIKKKTFLSAYNQLKLMHDLQFPNYQKGEPLHNLVMEIKRDLKKTNETTKSKCLERTIRFLATINRGTCYVVIYIVGCICLLVLKLKKLAKSREK